MTDPAKFIARWRDSSGSERANHQMFVAELCDLLGIGHPDPAKHGGDNAYVFEKVVAIHEADGSTHDDRIDCYKRGCFVLEAKQATLTGTTRRGTPAHAARLLKAHAQAVGYVRALDPKSEPTVPFLVVLDVGGSFDLFADFSGTNRFWSPFPSPNANRITLEQLAEPKARETLKAVWEAPHSLDPSARAQAITRDAAARLARLAHELERDHPADTVAAYLMRLFFTMFAEDVGLLQANSFTRLLHSLRPNPEIAHEVIAKLWHDMDAGGTSAVLHLPVLRFNGGLFNDTTALPLTREQLEQCISAAELDWSPVEPAIFGTLLERALDPRERHKLGAHFTPRAYVERLVMPTLIEPLRAEWTRVQEQVQHTIEDAARTAGKRADNLTARAERDDTVANRRGKKSAAIDTLTGDALVLLREFHRRLAGIRVLDPACGTGNFLYVALEHLKRIEGEVLALERAVGGGEQRIELAHLDVDPRNFLGLEINPRAAHIAELVLWIGYLQWYRKTHTPGSWPEPVLHAYHNIKHCDALIAHAAVEETGETRWDGHTMKVSPVTGEEVPDDSARMPVLRYLKATKAEWPAAEVIIGNPPFIGNKRMRLALGDGYVETVRGLYPDVPETADFVMYWWHIAAERVRAGTTKRFGLITTNSITQTFNRRVVQPHLDAGVRIAWAIPDHPWVDSVDGAAVRIAMTMADGETGEGRLLRVVLEKEEADGSHRVEVQSLPGIVNPDLTIGAAVSRSAALQANEGISFMGCTPVGEGFLVTSDQARQLGLGSRAGIAPHIRSFRNGKDLSDRPRGVLALDFFGLGADELRTKFPEAYQWLHDTVKPERDQNSREAYRKNWWIFAEARQGMRKALAGLPRYIATCRTAKHRAFVFLEAECLPDSKVIAIAHDDAVMLGILSSRIHLTWALRAGSHHGVGNDPNYNNSLCFDPFPFPTSTDAQATAIRAIAEDLDAHRKRQQTAHPGLTLTGMYNVLAKLRSGEALTVKEQAIHKQGLCSVLKDLHDRLDAAVAEAYGWPVDLPGDELLTRLVALNHERATEEAAGTIRWLRPAFQAPNVPPVKPAKPAKVKKDKAVSAKKKKTKWPMCIERCLKSYDSATMDWDDRINRYTIIREIYLRGLPEAFTWLYQHLTFDELRTFIASFHGDALAEAQRRRFRELFDLSEEDIPRHPFRDGSDWVFDLPSGSLAIHEQHRHASRNARRP